MSEQHDAGSLKLLGDDGDSRSSTRVSADIRETFDRLSTTWRQETGGLSSPSQIAAHASYQQIIDIGEPALRYIFEDLQAHGGQWYLALRAITGASPVLPEASGRARVVREAWLQWGRDHGYLR